MRGGAETESEISMDVPECEQAFRDAVSFMEGGGYGWVGGYNSSLSSGAGDEEPGSWEIEW